MMNSVSRYSVRDPNVLASTASESPVNTKFESQNVPLSSLNVQQTSTGRPVLGASASNYSEWNIDNKWSSQVWKSGEISNISTGRPVLAEQSDPLFAPANFLIMTPRPSIEIPAQEPLLQKYKERVERLPQPDRLIKICTDAGFLKTVEVGQYFMTKHTDEFLQCAAPVTCREYLLPRDEKSTDPKGWIRGNTKIGPVLEVTTCCLQSKYGV